MRVTLGLLLLGAGLGGCVAAVEPPLDAGARDAGAAEDAGGRDAGALDAGALDAGGVDAGANDAGGIDAGGCVPSCQGAVCGSDGCGGSCGTCPDNEACFAGTCKVGTCQPNCDAKDCGSDGCGGTCGDCSQELGDTTCDANINLCVWNGTPAGATVTWGGPCWWVCPQGGDPQLGCTGGQRFQAITFQQSSSGPMPLEATLYMGKVCDPSAGLADNLNDTGTMQGSGGWMFWFIHHPDLTPSSAVWWLGHSTTGCLDYTTAPDCQ